jgi:hypothetical protein
MCSFFAYCERSVTAATGQTCEGCLNRALSPHFELPHLAQVVKSPLDRLFIAKELVGQPLERQFGSVAHPDDSWRRGSNTGYAFKPVLYKQGSKGSVYLHLKRLTFEMRGGARLAG